MQVVCFTFNPFQENTYLILNNNECAIIDPGCNTNEENRIIDDFIEKNNLKPILLLQTHCHIDHILGTKYISEKYKLEPYLHNEELPLIQRAHQQAQMFGMPNFEYPEKYHFFNSNSIAFGIEKIEIIHTPGHSLGSVCFILHSIQSIIGGDVLFKGSIGRTDLFGGDFDTLIHSIKTKLLLYPDDYIVYSGHGPETTIGEEKKYNPFLS